MNGNTKDLVIEYVKAIADALCGEEQNAYGGGSLLRHNLGRIADYFEDNEIATGESLPAVTVSDNGKVLKVVDGVWAAALDSLPDNPPDDEAQDETGQG